MSAPAFVSVAGGQNFTGAGHTSLATSAFNLVAGNLVVVHVRCQGTISSITDTAGNTYTKDGEAYITASFQKIEIWSCANALGHATNVVTANFSSSSYTNVDALQFSGAATSSPCDTVATGTAASGATVSATATGTVHDQIVIAIGSVANLGTPSFLPSGFTSANTGGSHGISYRIEATKYLDGTREVRASFSNTADEKLLIVAVYKAASTASISQRVSQLVAEVATRNEAPMRVSQLVVEVATLRNIHVEVADALTVAESTSKEEILTRPNLSDSDSVSLTESVEAALSFPSRLSVALEAELSGPGNGWTDLSADVRLGTSPIEVEYGIRGGGPLDRVASVGTMTWAMNNAANNSVGLLGRYSPGHTNVLTGWDVGIAVRLKISYAGVTYYKFRGTLVEIVPDAGVHRRRAVLCTANDWMDEALNCFIRDTPVQTSKRSDEIIDTLVTNSSRRQPAATSYATGQSTFAYALDNLRDERTPLLRALADVVFAEVGYLYVKGDTTQGGTLTFEDRHGRTLSTLFGTFASNMQGLEVTRSRENLYNHVNAIVHPRQVDAAATTVIYELTPTETVPSIAPGATLPLTVFFRESTGRFVRVGATDIVTPVATTDYSANTLADGTGTDRTASLGIVFTSTSNSATLAITNNHGTDTVYITKLQVRGRVIADRFEISVYKHDTTSEDNYGERDLNYDMVYEDRPEYALALCDWFLEFYSVPRTVINALTLKPGFTGPLLTKALAGEPGHRILVTEEVSAVEGVDNYFINAVRLTIKHGLILETSWTLTPDITPIGFDAWLLEDADRGLLETSTYLGNV